MKILKNVLIGLIVLVAVLVVIGFLLPSSAHVERSAVIEAPPSTVFALANSFKRFNEWSPWAQIDPDGTSYTYEGPARGVGAKMSWQSANPKVGNGSQEITASQPNQRVESHLDFGDQGTATAYFALAPEGAGTHVTWGLDAPFGANPIGRYFGLFMDGMVGPEYERGLASLKTLAESLPDADFADLEVKNETLEPRPIACVSASSSQDTEAIGAAHAKAYQEVGKFMAKNHLQQAGAPLTINTSWDDAGFVFDACIPVDKAPETPVPEGSPVSIVDTYGGTVLRIEHLGSYDGLADTYAKIDAYVAAYGIETADRSWSEWVTDPGTVPEEELVTQIYYPVK